MKVGILTFNGVANYGAILQAYALFNVLKMAGHDVKLINYSTDQTYDLIQNHLYTNSYFAFNAIKEWRMNNFSHKHIKLTVRKYRTNEDLKKYAQNFDIIICRSDEIWNIHLPFQNYDFSYFLDFVGGNISKVSYSASFVHTSSDNISDNIVRVSQLLQSFSAISVRDKNSLQIVQSYDISAIKVLDPTFLCEYSKILVLPNIKRKYLLIYAHLSREEQSYAKNNPTSWARSHYNWIFLPYSRL